MLVRSFSRKAALRPCCSTLPQVRLGRRARSRRRDSPVLDTARTALSTRVILFETSKDLQPSVRLPLSRGRTRPSRAQAAHFRRPRRAHLPRRAAKQASLSPSLEEVTHSCNVLQRVLTGCTGGRPEATGPPPPPRTGIKALGTTALLVKSPSRAAILVARTRAQVQKTSSPCIPPDPRGAEKCTRIRR